ncbi:MAG: hypothetical protein ACOCRK_07065, partial [bacterium]
MVIQQGFIVCATGEIYRIEERDKYYRESKQWAKIKELIPADHCAVCGATKMEKSNFNRHHRNYDRWGNEKREDIVVACNRCHEITHFLEQYFKSFIYLNDSCSKLHSYLANDLLMESLIVSCCTTVLRFYLREQRKEEKLGVTEYIKLYEVVSKSTVLIENYFKSIIDLSGTRKKLISLYDVCNIVKSFINKYLNLVIGLDEKCKNIHTYIENNIKLENMLVNYCSDGLRYFIHEQCSKEAPCNWANEILSKPEILNGRVIPK